MQTAKETRQLFQVFRPISLLKQKKKKKKKKKEKRKKKNAITNKLQIQQNQPTFTHTQHQFPSLPSTSSSYYFPTQQSTQKIKPGLTYAKALTSQIPSQSSQINEQTPNNDLAESIKQLKSSDLDLFLRIINLIQKHYTKCTNNLDRVKATILIVKELEYDP